MIGLVSNIATRRRGLSVPAVAAALLLTVLGIGLRVSGLGREGFWLDEIFGATYTNLSLFETIVACLRFDVHPPLYYLQLNAWSVAGHGDIWLALNSVAWSTVTLVLVFLGTVRRFGSAAGLIALALCGVIASEVYFADDLRMYSMLGALMVSSWIAADRLLADYRPQAALPLVLLLIAVGALHGAGVVAVSAALLYVLPVGDGRDPKRLIGTWLGIASIVALSLVPWIAIASLRRVGQLEMVSISALTNTVSGWVVGYGGVAVADGARTAIAGSIAMMLLAGLWAVPGLRRLIGCFIAWPLAFTALICALGKPIWLPRLFAFCAPFLCIAVGALLGPVVAGSRGRMAIGWRAACATGLAAAWLAMALMTWKQSNTAWKAQQFREVAAYLRERVKPGDVIYIPDYVTFWGVARYLIGPEWGSPLDVEDPSNPDRSQKWPGIYQRLGPRALEMLHLLPRTRRVDGFSAPLFIGWSPLAELRDAKTVWIAGLRDSPLRLRFEDYTLCPGGQSESTLFKGLRVVRIACDAGGAPEHRPSDNASP